MKDDSRIQCDSTAPTPPLWVGCKIGLIFSLCENELNIGYQLRLKVMIVYLLWLNFVFLRFKLLIIHHYDQNQRQIKFEPRIKLSHNMYAVCCLFVFQKSGKCCQRYLKKKVVKFYKSGLSRVKTIFIGVQLQLSFLSHCQRTLK